MFSKMLVATDLTEAFDRVICTLGGLQAIGTREALLVHCFNVRDVGTLAESLMDLAAPILDR